MTARTFRYQTRIVSSSAQCSALDEYAALYGRVERTLFARRAVTGKPITDFKNGFLKEYGLSARQFNSIRVGLEGKIKAILKRQAGLIEALEHKVKKAEKLLKSLETRLAGARKAMAQILAGGAVYRTRRHAPQRLTLEEAQRAIQHTRFELHQKKRRLETLKARKARLEQDQRQGRIRLCFGSRDLFRAQFALEENGYRDLGQWRKEWRSARSAQFFVLGSKDETAGNQTCVATVTEDGSLALRLRLPDALAHEHGRYLTIPGVRFAYGQEKVLAALASSRRVPHLTGSGKVTTQRVGAALSYRFLRDEKGWRVFVSVNVPAPAPVSRPDCGAIGVDVNGDHLALTETDRFGNPIDTGKLPLPTYGKRSEQARALIGDVAVRLAAVASAAGKPVVIEELDFRRKKAELESAAPARARQLSSFAYTQVLSSIASACFRRGVELIAVNPAYTSVIGAVNYARRHGLSIHQGAALAIARRGLRPSESPTRGTVFVPTRSGGHVTFALPARNRAKHVWSHWSGIRRACKAALAAHARSGPSQGYPAPLPRPSLASRATLGIEGAIPSRQSPATLFG